MLRGLTMSKTRLSLISNSIKGVIVKKEPGIAEQFDPSKICLNVSECTGYSDKLQPHPELYVFMEGALIEGYHVQFLVAPKNPEAHKKWYEENKAKIDALTAYPNFELIIKADFITTESYKTVSQQFDDYFKLDENAERAQKLDEQRKIDLGKYAKNHTGERFDEDHPIVDAKLFLALAKMNKERGYLTTSCWHNNTFSATLGHVRALVDRMTEIGCKQKDLLLMHPFNKQRTKEDLFEVVEIKETVKKDREDFTGSEQSTLFDALTALVSFGKENVDAQWVISYINSADIQFDALTAMIKLGKEGVNPAWAAVVLCGVFFGDHTSMDLQLMVEKRDESDEETAYIKVTLAKNQVAMHDMSSQFEPVKLDGLTSRSISSAAIFKELESALRGEVGKRMQVPDAATAAVRFGKEKINPQWSAAFLKVYTILVRHYQNPTPAPLPSSLGVDALKEVRVESQADTGMAKITLATSQQVIDVMDGPFRKLVEEKVFDDKSPARVQGTVFAPFRAEAPKPSEHAATQITDKVVPLKAKA